MLGSKVSATRRGLVVLLVLALVATSLGPDTPSTSQDVAAPGHGPAQEWGDAAGLPHERSGRGNLADPASLQSKYPPVKGQKPAAARNAARVGEPADRDVRGFDAATSRELPELRQESQRTFANADGTQTSEFSRDPLNFQRSDKSWQPIDTRLVADGTGFRNAADSVAIRVAGTEPSAQLDIDDTHSLAFTVDGAAPSVGKVDGSAITYPQVRPGADLKLDVTTRGLKETISLASPDSPHEWFFPLRTRGLTTSIVDGEVVFRDEKGTERARIPGGFMVDSVFDEHMGQYTTSYGVTYELVDGGMRMTLDKAWLADPRRVYPVTVDPSVDVRPAGSSMYVQNGTSATNDLRAGHSTDSSGSYNAASYLAFPGVENALRNHKIFGAQLSLTNYHSWSCRARPVTVHPVTQAWTAGPGYSYPGPSFGPSLAGQSFAHGYIPSGQTSSPCPTAIEAIPLGDAGRDLVQRWADGTQANFGLTVRAAEDDVYGWKKFAQAGTANPPRLAVTHTSFNADYEFVNPVPNPPVTRNQGGTVSIKVTNRSVDAWTASGYALAYRIFDNKGAYLGWSEAASLTGTVARGATVTLNAFIRPLEPRDYRLEFTMMRRGGPVFTDEQIPPAVLVLTVIDVPPVVQELYPPNGYSAPSLTPTLWARAVDVDAPPGTAPQYRFEVCDENDANCFTMTRSASPLWTVPAGRLQWSRTYRWRVYASDGTSEGQPSPFSTLLTAVPQPEITAHLGNAPYGGRSGEFDPQVGNYTASAVDATVSTIGPKLSVVRTYNSLDPRVDAAFGAGWSSQYDMRITPDNDGSGNVVVTYPDGEQARFGANLDAAGAPTGGRLVSPPGRYATLVPRTAGEGGGWTLTDKSATLYVFRPDGRPSEIYDNAGRSLAFGYDANERLSTVTNRTSNRKLTVTWQGGHIRTVSTDPVDGAALTWTYTYEGDKLSQVCDPDGGCTKYEYTAGSHYRSTVVDARPDSYWRLGEPSGTDAQSQIGLNLGKDKATYTGVTLGTEGVVGADTAATFNGTTSAMTLPTGIVRKSRELTVELWFRTSSGGPLFSAQNQPAGTTPTAAVPFLYVGTDGKLHGQFWTGTVNQIVSTGTVNNNDWHHVVLSSTLTSQTLFLDGRNIGSKPGAIDHSAYNHSFVGSAFAITPSDLPAWGTAQKRSFAGVIDEVAVYQHPLGLPAVQAHYQARTPSVSMAKTVLPSGKTAAEMRYDAGRDRLTTYTDRNGGTWTLSAPVTTGTPTNIIRTVRVADPGNRAHYYDFDPVRGRILRYLSPIAETRPEDQLPPDDSVETPPPFECPPPEEDPFCDIPVGGDGGSFPPVELQGARTFTYDANGFQSTITDELGKSVTLTNDARGNVTSRKTCRTGGSCQTAYFEYPPVGSNLTDPRLDKVIAARDARSSGPTDNRYRTAYAYTTRGDLETQTTPDGALVRHTYTTDSTPAFGGGNTPAGLVLTSKNPRDAVTTYAYFSNGDLAEVRGATGLITRFTYDTLGRRRTTTQFSDTFPSGVTTTTDYDKLSHPTVETGPAVRNEISGVTHRDRTTTTYDVDGNPKKTESVDLTGDDPTRTATLGYDDHNRVVRITDAEDNETSLAYDRFGNTTRMVDATGVQYEYAYTTRNKLAEVRLRGWHGDPDGAEPGPRDYLVLASYSYALNGELTTATDAMGRTVRYTYYDDGLLNQTIAAARNLVLSKNDYDPAGNLSRQTTAGNRVTTFETDAVGRRSAMTADPGGLDRRTAWAYDPNGNVTQVRMSGRESNTGEFDDLTIAEVVDFGYDPTGRNTSETVHTGTEDLTTLYGYDQRGLLTSSTDPASATWTYRNDELGRPVAEVAPPVEVESVGTTRPTTLAGYDNHGNTTHTKDANGNTWRSAYDKINRLTSTTTPEYTPPGAAPITATARFTYDGLGNVLTSTSPRGAVTGYTYDQLGRLVEQVDPHADNPGEPGDKWQYTYTRTGELLSTTDPTGARTEQTYDDLGRLETSTQQERFPTPGTYTATYGYDDANNVETVTAPSQAITAYDYDKLDQLTKVTSPSGVDTQLGYDRSGRPAVTADELGRKQRTNYDLAGRATQVIDLSPNGVPLRKSKLSYDRAGNLATVTNPLNNVTTLTSDALGRLTQQVEPVSATESITTSFGYDAAGNQVRFTDGRNNTTRYTVNEWSLTESVVEPSTTAHPNLADRTWTFTYDADANPSKTSLPGGIERTGTYDLMDRMTGATATGAPTKTFDHDPLGRVKLASTPAGENRFTYNDRGELLSTGGPSGDTNLTYNEDGNLTGRTDASGTAIYGYTNGRLSTVQDGVTGVSQALSYNDAGELSTVNYGGGRLREFTYDDLGRVKLDKLGTTASTEYGYDNQDRLKTKTTTGVLGAGVNTYDYDQSDRLTSWTTQPTGGAATTTTYGWDKAGNRTSAAGKTSTYDERNRLQSDGTDTYTYAPRGTLSAKSGAAVTYDGFDRLMSQGGQNYTYDALDRVATRNSTTFKYTGASNELTSDGTTTFGRGPSGELLSTRTGTNQRLTMSDQHGDVVATLPTTGASLSDSTTYDPWGKVTAGTTRTVGYQGDYTDPTTGQVNMTARWYDPNSGGFTTRDDVPLPTSPSGAANRYAYGLGAPTNYSDQSGNCPICIPIGIGLIVGGLLGESAKLSRNGHGSFKGKPLKIRPCSSKCGLGKSNGSSGGIGSGLGLNGRPTGPRSGGGGGGGGALATATARAAAADAARNNPMPIPKAMTAPVYDGSVAPPVSSAPDVPSHQADDYRDPVDDVNESYQQLQQDLTDDDNVLGTVPATTSAPTEVAPGGDGSGGGGQDSGCVVWDWLCDAGNALVDAFDQVVGFFTGVFEVAFETLAGIAHMAWNIAECLNPWSDACAENVQAVTDFLGALIDDPLGVLGAIWDGITQPIKEDWNNGDYGEAIGRGFATVAGIVAGAKGAGKLRSGEPKASYDPAKLAEYANGQREVPGTKYASEYRSPSGEPYHSTNRHGQADKIKQIPELAGPLARSGNHHGGCAEIGCLLDAYRTEGPGAIVGGAMRTVHVRNPRSPRAGEHGEPAHPCLRCGQVLDILGIDWK
ncbi:RHS repeat-associated core domain-containing protein [Actinophytocola oryzae]|uniref:RHS repeat-associated core domain-containing protein n=1 Tax=Actinophytocola oryzae TaxID=502181 RepID=UPI001062624F|nr:RHS repeat-associated core domain-containing protein [Actinophytocola oryzae]